MHVLVLAAGYGLRLRPLTLVYPKPLVPVLNRPLLAFHLAQLRRLGCRQVYVNRHYLAEKFPDVSVWRAMTGVEVRYLDEVDTPYGTGGAIRNLVQHAGPDDVLVVNGDTLFLQDLHPFLDVINDRSDPALLLVRAVPERGYTVLYHDPNSRRLSRQPFDAAQRVMYAGVAWLSSELVKRIPETFPSDWFRDAWEPAEREGARFRAYLTQDAWWDLGDADRFWLNYEGIVKSWASHADKWNMYASMLSDAGRWLQPEVWVHPTARIATGAEFAGWTVVGAGVHIGEGTCLQQVVVDRDVQLVRSRIERGFLGPGVTVEGFEIRDAVVYQRDQQVTLVSW